VTTADEQVGSVIETGRLDRAEAASPDGEDRFRTLVQGSRDAVALLDATTSIVWISPVIEQLTGWKPEQLIGRGAFELIHPDDLESSLSIAAQAYVADEHTEPATFRMENAFGEFQPIEVVAAAVRDDAGDLDSVIVNLRDVRWRVAADEARRESERRFKALVQSTFSAVLIIDRDAVIIFASPAVERLFGRPAGELVGTRGTDFIHPDDLVTAQETLASALAQPGAGAHVEIRAFDQTGDWRWVEVEAVNMFDDEAVQGLVVHVRDITARKVAQLDATRSEERFRSLVEHSTAIVAILDETGRVKWASDSSDAMDGYSPDDVMGRFAGDFAHPDDVATSGWRFEDIVGAPGSTTTFESRLRQPTGGWRWYECTFTNRLDDPTVDGVIANVHDITDRKLAEIALAESERLFRGIAQSSPVGIYQQDSDNQCVYVNERWQEITGYSFEEALGNGWMRVVHPDDRRRFGVDEAVRPVRSTPTQTEFRVVRSDGAVRWVALRSAPTHDDGGELVGSVGTIEDITDRRAAQRDNQRLIDIFEATNDVVGIVDPTGEILYLNAAARRFFGLSETGVISALALLETVPPSTTERMVNEIQPGLERDGMWSGELAVTDVSGEVIPMLAQLLVHRDAEGNMEFVSGVLHDIRERKQFESALAHQATHDPLTGMPNRTLLLDRLDVALTRARRHSLRVAVLFLDLDHFKVVNDSLGHDLGDRLLVAIADRLHMALRPGDTIARFGGDEFVLLCQDLHSRGDAIAIAERVISAVSGPFAVDDAEVFVGLSIGIAFPDNADADPVTLIRDADAAMYRAKERGRGRWEIFDNDLRASAVDRLDIENALRRALDRRELRVFYQPIVELESGTISGVEALLRWEHGERGLLLPGEFIGIAEETGLIVPIGLWVLDQACRQVQRWQASIPDLSPLVVSVNLSGRQLGHPKLVDDINQILTETGLPAERLELEITESVLMDDVEMSEDTLGRLNDLGVRLVVDDFGTGYSSMSYLRRFPVDLLKVDREFVDGLGTDPSDSAIVAAIVTLAHTLGLEAVAEGVETSDQLDELRSLGCDKGQGFLMARPGTGADVAELLQARPVW
jgi:diguanylate cyclase (GGDEF)-like protein/PAS domain S-box-containing protein